MLAIKSGQARMTKTMMDMKCADNQNDTFSYFVFFFLKNTGFVYIVLALEYAHSGAMCFK